MAESMVERVARAIRFATDQNWTGDHLPFDAMARAAIEELRRPTEAMVAALESYGAPLGILEEGWDAAIDAALQEKDDG